MNRVDAIRKQNASRNKVIIVVENRFPYIELTKILQWCHETMVDDAWDWEHGISSLHQFKFYFDNANDATLFALRWS